MMLGWLKRKKAECTWSPPGKNHKVMCMKPDNDNLYGIILSDLSKEDPQPRAVFGLFVVL